MTPISETLHELLVRQGFAQERTAIRQAQGMKERGAASDGARSQLRQREDAADLNSGKDRGNVTPAKFTGLHIVVDNCRNGRTQPQRVAPLGVRPFLKLVWSQ